MLVLDVLLQAAFFLFELVHLTVKLFLFFLEGFFLVFLIFQQGSLFLSGLLAGFHLTRDLPFGRGNLFHLDFAGIVELPDVAQSGEGLVEVLGGKNKPQVIVMVAVFVGKRHHFRIFFAKVGQVCVQALDVFLSGVDFLVKNRNLFIVCRDELLALLDFLVEKVDLVEGHLLVFLGFCQQLVGSRNLLLQRSDFVLQLLLRLAFGLLRKRRVDQG